MRSILALFLALFAVPVFAQHNGTAVGTPTYGTGKFSQALTAVSDTNYVSLPTGSLPTTSGTGYGTKIWLKNSTNTGTYQVAFSATTGGSDYWIGANAAGHFFVNAVTVPSSGLDSGISILDGAWHFCEVTVSNAGLVSTFVDHVAGATATGTTPTTATSGYIGRYSSTGFAWQGSIDEVSNWNTNYVAPSVPSTPYVGNEANLVGLYHLDNNANDSYGTVTTQTIAPNNSAWIYSPANWTTPTSGLAQTINPGAYARIITNSTTAALTFTVASLAGNTPTVNVRIDHGTVTRYNLAASVSIATGMTSRNHLIEFYFSARDISQTAWTTAAQMVQLTGLVLDSSATVTAPTRRTKTVWVYGDSITEGFRALMSDGTLNNPAEQDAAGTYIWALSEALDAEVGVIAFSGTGLTVTGNGSVPALTSTYNFIYSGVSRSFASCPNLFLFNEGENDNTAAIGTAFTTVSSALLTSCPTTPQMWLIPFSQREAANLRTAVSGAANGLVSIVETSGWANPSDTNNSPDGQHYYNAYSLGVIGPKLFPSVAAKLYPTGKGVTYF